MSFELIEAEEAHYPKALMCRALGLSRSGHHAFRTRGPSRRALEQQLCLSPGPWRHPESTECRLSVRQQPLSTGNVEEDDGAADRWLATALKQFKAGNSRGLGG